MYSKNFNRSLFQEKIIKFFFNFRVIIIWTFLIDDVIVKAYFK